MPNIHIHGVNQKSAKILEKDIFKTLSDRSYADDVVVTIHNTSVRDRNGNPQPFLQVANSERWNTEEIVKKLKHLGLDIEVVGLEGFHPGIVEIEEEA